MTKSALIFGKWLSIFLAVVSSVWLLFGQLYVIQFILLAYVLHTLANQPNNRPRKRLFSFVIIVLTVLSSAATIYAGIMVEHGFRGTDHYSTPGALTITLSLADAALMVLTLALYAKVLRNSN